VIRVKGFGRRHKGNTGCDNDEAFTFTRGEACTSNDNYIIIDERMEGTIAR